MAEPITTTEWLAEIERLQAQMDTQPEGLSTKELKEALDMNEKRISEFLDAMHKAGRLVVGQRPLLNHYSGRRYYTTVYSIRKENGNG